MARTFDGANDRVLISTPIVTAAPFTMSCWFKSTSVTADQCLMSTTQAAGTNGFSLRARGNQVGDPVSLIAVGGATGTANTSTGYSANVWNHAAGVVYSSTSRAVFLNGGGKGADTTPTTPGAIVESNFGLRYNSNAFNEWFSGNLAEFAVWNLALTDAEIKALSSGVSAYRVRPESLIFYLPAVRNMTVLRGNSINNDGNVPASDHPPITFP